MQDQHLACLRPSLYTALLGPATRWISGAGFRVEQDITYVAAGGRPERLDVFVPDGPAPAGGRPVILAIHDGGWRQFDKGEYGRNTASLFAPCGYVVVSVNYTLSSPGSPSWPANIEDIRNAVRWVRSHAASFGADPDRIAAVGESAGGHLAALLGTDPGDPIGAGRGHPPAAGGSEGVSARVQAVVDISGPTNLTSLAPGDLSTIPFAQKGAASAVWQFLGGTSVDVPDRYRAASPVSHVSGGDPPVLLIHGAADPYVPARQSEELASALTAAGVPNRLVIVPGASHGFQFEAQGRRLLPEILAFLDACWDRPEGSE